ncbi:hypothetical protein ACHAO7_012051 [Fusarium culmorum]
MSTNSGEDGFCKFCGHLMNVHTKASSSKCTNLKCKKRFLVCQAGVHNGGGGWRLCDVPCGCGPTYYPSTAKQAYPLAPIEYASSHPLYESPSPEGEDNTFASHSSPEASSTSTNNPAYVDVTNNGHYFQFYGHDGGLITTVREHWQQTRVDYQGVKVEAWQMNDDDTGLSYFTWTLDVPDSQGAHEEQSERSLGKQVAQMPQPTSHGRTLSEESIDPLQWNEEQLKANSVASRMAGLTIGGSSSSRDLVHGSARLDKKGRVCFKPEAGGEEVKSLRNSWVEAEDGFIFESKTHGCKFFTKQIKLAKK